MAYRGPSVELVGQEGRSFRLKPGARVLVGRTPSSDWTLPHASVSRQHARLSWDEGDPRPKVHDLGSANGTFLDGLRLSPHEAAYLTDEAVLAFGGLEFSIRLERALAGPALIEEDTGTVALVGDERERSGTSDSWEDLTKTLLRIENDRATGTLRLEGKEERRQVMVLLGGLRISRTEGVRLLAHLRDGGPPLAYHFTPQFEIGTLGGRTWRISELLSLLDG